MWQLTLRAAAAVDAWEKKKCASCFIDQGEAYSFNTSPIRCHKSTPPFLKRVGHCVKCKQKLNTMICKSHKSIFYSQGNIENRTNAEAMKLYRLFLEKNKVKLIFVAATHLIKVETGSCFPLWSILSFVCKHFWSEQTSGWRFRGRMLSRSCLVFNSPGSENRCAQTHIYISLIQHFQMCELTVQ